MCLNIKSQQVYTKEKPVTTKPVNEQVNTPAKVEEKLDTTDRFKNQSDKKTKASEFEPSGINIDIGPKIVEPPIHTTLPDLGVMQHEGAHISPQIKNLIEEKKISLDDVKKAQKNEPIFKLNESGPAVAILKDRLQQLGLICGPGDKFDEITMKSLKNFQEAFVDGHGRKSPMSGVVDKNTWNALNEAAFTFKGNAVPQTKEGKALASAGSDMAGSRLRGGGHCYGKVWDAVVKAKLNGKINPPATTPARDFNDWALGSGKNVMARVLPTISSDGKTILGLKPGDIVVYEKGVQGHHSKFGHIEIYGGVTGKDKNGNTTNVFYSDFKNIQQGTDQIMNGIKNGQIKNGAIKIYRFNPEQSNKPPATKK